MQNIRFRKDIRCTLRKFSMETLFVIPKLDDAITEKNLFFCRLFFSPFDSGKKTLDTCVIGIVQNDDAMFLSPLECALKRAEVSESLLDLLHAHSKISCDQDRKKDIRSVMRACKRYLERFFFEAQRQSFAGFFDVERTHGRRAVSPYKDCILDDLFFDDIDERTIAIDVRHCFPWQR